MIFWRRNSIYSIFLTYKDILQQYIVLVNYRGVTKQNTLLQKIFVREFYVIRMKYEELRILTKQDVLKHDIAQLAGIAARYGKSRGYTIEETRDIIGYVLAAYRRAVKMKNDTGKFCDNDGYRAADSVQ